VKAQERHQLKQNDFAHTAARVLATVSENRQRALATMIAVVAVAAIVGGYFWWTKRAADRAGAMLGEAMSIANAPIAPPPTVPGATQTPGTYPTESAREEAAIQALQRVASEYGSTDAGLAARFQLAATFLRAGRAADAEKTFREVADAGSDLYGASARMGVAESMVAQSKLDEAIQVLTELSGDRNGPLPIDGVLMQLARTCARAGKTQDARAAYKRIVDEFPESTYVTEARQQLTLLG
jgi:TolA-binding protein